MAEKAAGHSNQATGRTNAPECHSEECNDEESRILLPWVRCQGKARTRARYEIPATSFLLPASLVLLFLTFHVLRFYSFLCAVS